MKSLHFISMTTDNALRVLQRIASVFSKNRINIEQLNVFETKTKNISHFNVVICTEGKLVEKVLKQLGKIVECHEVHVRSTRHCEDPNGELAKPEGDEAIQIQN